MENWEEGVSIVGKKFSNLRNADDTLMLCATVEELETFMLRLERFSLEYGLRINWAKTKVMNIDRENNNQPHVR